jgi:hypothetical protein
MLTTLACVALAAFAAGCGDEDPPAQPDLREQAKEATVTRADIRKAPNDSPEETLLTWWRLTQFRSTSATEQFTPEAAAELEQADYDRLAFRYLGPWLATAKPEIDEVQSDDDTANLFLTLSGPAYLSPTKATIELARVDDEWLISDPTFMLEQAQLLREQEVATRNPEPAPDPNG